MRILKQENEFNVRMIWKTYRGAIALGGAITWALAGLVREVWLPNLCIGPSACPKIMAFDWIDIWGKHLPLYLGAQADSLSDAGQSIAIALPITTLLLGIRSLRLKWPTWILFEGGTRFLTAAALNGITLEVVRLIVRRPRPTVNPDSLIWLERIPKATFYTSFYSGHTSFTVVSALMTLILARELSQNPHGTWSKRHYFLAWTLFAFANALFTGLFRVAAKRHYLSDVIAAATFAFLAVYIAEWIHRQLKKKEALFTRAS
jgi:membrane-associated phospholipid phosphatase